MRFVPLLSLLLLPACATIVNGSTQAVAVNSSPTGSSCTVDRTGARLGMIPATPGSLILQRNSNELLVTCTKEGYTTAAKTIPASFNGTTFGNLLFGGIVGIVVDASSGANHSYPDAINVEMAANPATSPVVSGTPVASADQPYMPGTPIHLTPVVQSVSAPASVTPTKSPRI